jgi:serine carboxypeptidase 1
MTAYFGAALVDAKLPINFKGVALGDGWVDPLGCMDSYAPYLTTFSQISPAQATEVTAIAKLATAAWKNGNGTLATNLWSAQQDLIQLYTNNLNWYNSLYYYDYTADNQLDTYLNSTAFNQVLMFHGVHLPAGFYYNKQSNDVFSYMSGHFMDNGTAQVLKMLEAGLDVNVYGGQLDLIVDTLCIQGWLYNLPWAGMEKFKSVNSRSALTSAEDNQTMYGFVQSYQNLHFWQINGAGHMVPLDQPAAAFRMFEDILSGSSVAARDNAVQRKPVNRRKRLV